MDGGTRGLGSRVGDGWRTPTRRLLLVGAGAAALAVLADRGLRLGARHAPPPLPTPRPGPAARRPTRFCCCPRWPASIESCGPRPPCWPPTRVTDWCVGCA